MVKLTCGRGHAVGPVVTGGHVDAVDILMCTPLHDSLFFVLFFFLQLLVSGLVWSCMTPFVAFLLSCFCLFFAIALCLTIVLCVCVCFCVLYSGEGCQRTAREGPQEERHPKQVQSRGEFLGGGSEQVVFTSAWNLLVVVWICETVAKHHCWKVWLIIRTAFLLS